MPTRSPAEGGHRGRVLRRTRPRRCFHRRSSGRRRELQDHARRHRSREHVVHGACDAVERAGLDDHGRAPCCVPRDAPGPALRTARRPRWVAGAGRGRSTTVGGRSNRSMRTARMVLLDEGSQYWVVVTVLCVERCCQGQRSRVPAIRGAIDAARAGWGGEGHRGSVRRSACRPERPLPGGNDRDQVAARAEERGRSYPVDQVEQDEAPRTFGRRAVGVGARVVHVGAVSCAPAAALRRRGRGRIRQ